VASKLQSHQHQTGILAPNLVAQMQSDFAPNSNHNAGNSNNQSNKINHKKSKIKSIIEEYNKNEQFQLQLQQQQQKEQIRSSLKTDGKHDGMIIQIYQFVSEQMLLTRKIVNLSRIFFSF
jgi:hypothetical protein